MNAVSAEMLRRVSVFQRTLDEREIVTEDEGVHSCVLGHEKELPNRKIKLYVSPQAYMYSRLVAT